MISRFEKFSYGISEISKYWKKLAAEEMEKYGLKANHSVYLTALDRNFEDGLTAAQICEYSGRDKADVSRMMSIMEEKGLVKKEGIHQNLYKGVFKLTNKGKEAADHVNQRAGKAVELAGGELTEENRAIFYESLDIIVKNLKKLCERGIPD